jgi:hypothetical protein
MLKRLQGWLWMIGAVAAVVAVQALAQSGGLRGVDGLLNGARPLVPATIAVGAFGVIILLVAMAHGLATDAARVEPGKISGGYRGRGAGGSSRIGWFSGFLLWGAEFHEESGIAEVKRSWRSGEWLVVNRYLRATMIMAGLPLVVFGTLATVALVIDTTAVRLLLLAALVYALARFAYVLARA